MHSYHNLNQAFPYKYQSTRSTIRYMVKQLIEARRDDAPNGSSFAITTDAPDGMWNLWLSEVSMQFIVNHMPHVNRNLIDNEYEM